MPPLRSYFFESRAGVRQAREDGGHHVRALHVAQWPRNTQAVRHRRGIFKTEVLTRAARQCIITTVRSYTFVQHSCRGPALTGETTEKPHDCVYFSLPWYTSILTTRWRKSMISSDVTLGSGRPKYEQVASDLTDRIRSGEYPAGKLLPTLTQLGEQYAVSQITV